MKSDYFIDFIYHDQALKQQENLKFMLQKYRQNKEVISTFKSEKVRQIDNLIAMLDLIETEIKEFKRLLPTSQEAQAVERGSEPIVKTKIVKKKTVKKAIKKTPVKKSDINSLKLGLEKIRDELANM